MTYSLREASLIARLYDYTRTIERDLKREMEFLQIVPDNESISDELRSIRDERYTDLQELFSKAPQKIRDHPLLVEAMESLDQKVGLIHS